LGDAAVTEVQGMRVTSIVRTFVDLAVRLPPAELEGAIGAADKDRLIDPEALRVTLEEFRGRPGVAKLRKTLDRRTFRLTRSQLERRFLRIVRLARLPMPETGAIVNGFEVDFYWPGQELIVETDGLTYHRTPAQQAEDRLRDQIHAAAELIPLRFTHAQVHYQPGHVAETLRAVGLPAATASRCAYRSSMVSAVSPTSRNFV
jgi:very-short-patch-repair endonuclease